jgi:hypothetical protein
MKTSTLLSLIAIVVALAGLLVSVGAYFKKNRCSLCDNLDDMLDDDDDYLDYSDLEEYLVDAEEDPAEYAAE